MLITHIIAFIIILIICLYRGYKRWFLNGLSPQFNNIAIRTANMIKYGILQRKVIYKKAIGIIHILIYAGFIVLLIGVIIRALEADLGISIINNYRAFGLTMNVCWILSLAGAISAMIRRKFFRSKYLPTSKFDYLILLSLILILITAYILDGLNVLMNTKYWVVGRESIGYIFVSEFIKDDFTILLVYRLFWFVHIIITTLTMALIPYTKLYHLIAGGIINTFFSRLEHPSAFKHIPNIDEIVEKGDIPGANSLISLSWKQRMDYDACVNCARCTDNCPATESGKPLNPMDLILTLRSKMDIQMYKDNIVPSTVDPDVIWSCVTCGACVYQCPVLIHHIETIFDIRRFLHGSGENIPNELIQVSYNIMRYGNPLAYNPVDRERYIDELIDETGIEIAEPNKEYDFIYWMGCNTSYDPVAKPIAKALLKLLIEARYDVAVLAEESCCGEPARRIGDELLFKELVKTNGEILSKYKFKRLLVTCPHGYNIFKHEYPLYGVNVDVVHHSTVLHELIKNHRIKINKFKIDRVTYHDPCYLGRWNNIYKEPREIIRQTVDGHLIELKRSRKYSFCCGAGGGHLFFELKKGERIGKIRMREIINSKVNAAIVACPFCKIMLKSEAPDEIRILDIAELLAGITE